MANLLKAQLSILHRRERKLLAKAKGDIVELEKLERSARRLRKQAKEVIFLA